MSFKDCLDTAVTTGRVAASKAETAKEVFDQEVERALLDGVSEADALAQAFLSATEALAKTTSQRRWQKLNEIHRAHEIHTRIKNADNIPDAITELMTDLELDYDTTMAFAMANLSEFLTEYRPRTSGIRRKTAGLENIAPAAYGEINDPVAKRMAESIQQTMEVLRLWANRYGANIPDNPNNRMFQTHDAVRVSRVTRDTWVNEHLADGVLDWDLMEYAGKKIEPGQRKEVLERVYDAIVTDGYNDPKRAQVNPLSLANRLNRDRFLYYKTGAAWNEMQGKYGAGNVHQQVIGMIDAMAKDISVLKRFGPSPDSMFQYMKREAIGTAGERDLAAGAAGRKLQKQAERRVAVAEDEMKIHSRHVLSLENNLPVQTFSAIKTLSVSAVLGAAFVPSFFSDQINSRMARNMMNMPTSKAFTRYWSEFAMTDAKIEEAITSGVIFEHGISIATQRARYFGLMDGPMWARNVGEFTYRFGMTSLHTQVARNAAGKNFQFILHQHRGMEFDELPFAAYFVEHGITKADWDAMRAVPSHDVRGGKFLRPIDLFQGGNPAAAEKFGNAMQMFIKTSVPDTNLRTQAETGGATNPNTVLGQAVRTMAALTSFPVSLYFNQLRRISHHPNKLTMAMKYFAWMTAGGMFITQSKALISGQQPYDMLPVNEDGEFDPLDPSWLDFMGRSVVNGGSLGILGDVLFNTIDTATGGYKSGSPTEEYIKSLAKLTVGNSFKAVQGKDTSIAKDSLAFAQKNIPSFWQTKLIVNRYLADEMLMQADPAAWERKKRYEAEHEAGMWWAMGEEPDL